MMSPFYTNEEEPCSYCSDAPYWPILDPNLNSTVEAPIVVAVTSPTTNTTTEMSAPTGHLMQIRSKSAKGSREFRPPTVL